MATLQETKSECDARFLHKEVQQRLGLVPNVFCSAHAVPQLNRSLWTLAVDAYLNSPLPPLFKERLVVHLSRFCEVRYCIARHAAFLLGSGNVAGNAEVEPQSMDEIVQLISRELPDAADLLASLDRLKQQKRVRHLPASNEQFERDLFNALTAMFLEPRHAARASRAVRHAVGESRFELLTAFLLFVRAAHMWTETHPDIEFEPDVVQIMKAYPTLRSALLSTSDAAAARSGGRLFSALHDVDAVDQRSGRRTATAHKNMLAGVGEQSREDSEQRLRVLIQSIRDYAMLLIDDTGHVIEWTEGAQQVFGYKAGEIVGKHIALLYPREDVAAGMAVSDLTIASRLGRVERESFRVNKFGRSIWVNEITVALHDENETCIGYTRICRDIGDNKRSSEAQRDADDRFKLLVDNVSDHAIVTLDATGRIVTWNQGAARLFKYSATEAAGRSIAFTMTPADYAAGLAQRELSTAVSAGTVEISRWHVARDGTQFWATGVTSAMRDATGALRGFTQVLRDETELHMLQLERDALLKHEQSLREEAQRALVIKDEFIAVVSHELRTPLSAILLWSKALLEGLQPEQQVRAHQSILRSAEAQRRLIEDLLDVSRMMSGQLRINVRDTDIVAIVQSAMEAIRVTADAKQISLTATLEVTKLPVRADPDRMQQVLWNLLTNAVKFTPAHGEVHVHLQQQDAFVQITITDTGSGISPAFLPHAFERFRQADASSTRKQGGLGLGLAITRQLVELHGGTIRAESTGVGAGSAFTIDLPIIATYEAPAVNAPVVAAHLHPFSNNDGMPGLRVLLVEDDDETRSAMQSVLNGWGADVLAVNCVADALEEFENSLDDNRFDVIVSDIGMPGENGYDLITRARQVEQRHGVRRLTPAVALTAYARPEDSRQALVAGFQRHVTKPVEPALLSEVLRSLAPPPEMQQ